MSRIWICQGKTAEIPFLVEKQNINLYSLEELCYYLYQNAEVIEEAFFEERLFQWLEKELEQKELADRVRTGVLQGKSGYWCMEVILWESGCYTKAEVKKIRETLLRVQQADPIERKKLLADRMLSGKKYKSAAREYQQLLLEMTDGELKGRIWHNLGTAYAGQFLFARAAECYEKAYKLGHLEESSRQYLAARACAEGELQEEYAMAEDTRLHQLRETEGFLPYETEVYQALEQLAEEYMRSE